MANLSDIITDYSPPASGVNVPLRSTITVEFGLHMDEARLQEDFFIEGPDTDQFIGPGLLSLDYPENISQGDLDDFLRSPGYKGIVQGTYEFESVSGVSTTLTFTPTRPLAATTEYTVNISETLDAEGNTVSGHVTWGFSTGTGSIEELPSSISTSILAAAPQAIALAVQEGEFAVLGTLPKDHSIEQDLNLEEIIVEFNKDIDSGSVSAANITVETIPATDHPGASASAAGDLAKTVEVTGRQLKIKI